MKTLKFSLLFTIYTLMGFQSSESFESAVYEAIKAVLKDHFALHEPKVDLFFYGPESEILANELLRDKVLEVSVRVIRMDTAKELQVDFPSIFLFDTCEHSHEMFGKIKWTSQNGLLHNNLVYAPKKGKLDIIALLSKNKFAFENQNFITIVENSTVDLVTSFKYSPEICNSIYYQKINQFSTDTKERIQQKRFSTTLLEVLTPN
jgi:hypothetical protein